MHTPCCCRVKGWCFSPPGALMSPGASKQLEGMCTSVVIAKDMIPRLSIKTFQHLRDQMMRAAALCKLPKAKVGPGWTSGLSCSC